MIDRVPAALAPALARAPVALTTSATKRSPRELALACVVVTGLPTSGVGPSWAASDEKASARPGPAAAKPAEVKPTVEIVYSNAGLLQRRRQVIARMLEGSLVYRTLFDVKLIHAKLAGPFPYKVRNALFSSETHTVTLYCARADFDVPWIHAVGKSALILVGQSSNGSERLNAKVSNSSPFECRDANYGPFPELEQLRAKRRNVLGKSD